MTLRTAIWLLPAAFVLHDGEEILTMPRWIAGHRAALEDLASAAPAARRLLENLPTTTGAVAVAVLAELVIVLGATLAVHRAPARGPGVYLYAAVLGALSLHVISHLAQSVAFGGYTPGVVTAVVVIPPAATYVYRALFGAGLLTRRAAAVSALAGAAAVLPVVVAAHYVGRALWR